MTADDDEQESRNRLGFSAALQFAYLRKASGSLVPALAAHSSFNLAMYLTIFGFLWTP